MTTMTTMTTRRAAAAAPTDDNADERRAARDEAAEARGERGPHGAAPLRRAVRVFNGRYTVTSPTGEHRTFRVATRPNDAEFAPGKRTVAILRGPDNGADYVSFGFIDDAGLSVWKKFRGAPGEPSFFEKLAPVFWSLATEGERSKWHARGMRLLLEGTCVVCNRALTDPESIQTGVGPKCAGRV